MRGKTIRQFLIDGIPDGRWVSELPNWTGKAYKIPRTYINQCADRIDLEYTGVYFLFGQNENSERPQVYIGETENILVRLKQHMQDKDFWTECVAFISISNIWKIIYTASQRRQSGMKSLMRIRRQSLRFLRWIGRRWMNLLIICVSFSVCWGIRFLKRRWGMCLANMRRFSV